MQKHVVIVGAGFGGTRAALDLAKHHYDDIQITIIDKNSYHVYTPDLYEAAAAFMQEDERPHKDQFVSLRSTVSIPLKEIFKKQKKINLVRDEVAKIMFDKNIVETKSGKIYTYDWVIVAIGSETNCFEIPNLKERSYGLKTSEEALNIRNAIYEMFFDKAKHETIKIVVGGGGFTGCELISELVGYTQKLAKSHAHPKSNIELIVLEAGDSVLGGTNKWIQEKAASRLKKLGVKVLTSHMIVGIEDKKVIIKDKDPISYDILIWTAGVCANQMTESLDNMKIEKGGCIAVDEYMKASLQDNVFVVGDVAHCSDSKKGRHLPMAAEVAIDQGRYVAGSIKRLLHKRRAFPYIPHEERFIIPLGKKYALASIGFIKISGFIPWILKRFIALKYFLSILPPHKAFILWVTSFKLYIKND